MRCERTAKVAGFALKSDGAGPFAPTAGAPRSEQWPPRADRWPLGPTAGAPRSDRWQGSHRTVASPSRETVGPHIQNGLTRRVVLFGFVQFVVD